MNNDLRKMKEFYESKWKSVQGWKRERGPYLKKSVDVEAIIGLKWLKQELDKEDSVLTIGCGGGRNTIFFEQEGGFETHGIDLSINAIMLAEKLKKEKRSNAFFAQASVLKLPYKSESFHAVTDYGCLHHLKKEYWEDYVNSVKAVLKRKGFFLVYTFSAESGETGNYNPRTNKNWSNRSGHYNHYFRKQELHDLFSDDFNIIKIKTIKEENRVLVFYLTLMQKL